MTNEQMVYTTRDPVTNEVVGPFFYLTNADIDWLAVELGYRAADALRGEGTYR